LNELLRCDDLSFTPHPTDEDLALDDLVGRLAIEHPLACEFLTALGATQIALGVVFDDPLYETFDQTAGAPFPVLVQQAPASRAVYPNGPAIWITLFCHP